ncbi:Transcriptional regulator, AbiEi antitoxin, Type IV TA system [Microbacterium azadirachtae]|uniref:Transcriptional regulator, AbiEi antitoxin, Type IV TA system n=1 Tax=Microbacterium azadirachtae TaxID=582680 RepID=A0A1I6GHA5_9MICO|nr:hypothetical protein [Microbacterium azadirachtae]SFR41540.1 Transcriptional regulator, AbiEi antitoxin, Type IV TA system [Microbacterium azadirachtae]
MALDVFGARAAHPVLGTADRLTPARAQALLFSRDDLIQAGHTERGLRAPVAENRLIRVRRGRYVHADDWAVLWNDERHLLDVIAAHRNSSSPGLVFWGPSAAVLHGLPLYRWRPLHVHAVVSGARHTRARARLMLHDVTVGPADVTDVDGIRCTVIDRTVLDLLCGASAEVGLSAADAALRAEAVQRHGQNPERAQAWRARMNDRSSRTHVRGIRAARELIDFADGRAQLPGESVSRLQLLRLGYRRVPLQTPVHGPDGEEFWLDFAFPRSRAFGEFDGQGKYRDPRLRGGRHIEDVVLAEKHREDIVRGVTGWRTVRWSTPHIRTADALGARLHAFGIRPPT